MCQSASSCAVTIDTIDADSVENFVEVSVEGSYGFGPVSASASATAGHTSSSYSERGSSRTVTLDGNTCGRTLF